MNRGDWAEIYVILYSILNKKISVGDEEENLTNEEINIQSIELTRGGKKYVFIEKDNLIKVYVNNENTIDFEKEYLTNLINTIYNKIVKEHTRERNIKIQEGESFIYKVFTNINYKEINKKKYDVKIKLRNGKNLNVNIKSNLWYPPTLLNASEATKVGYEIIGMTDQQMQEVNNINTTQKVIDRIEYIFKVGNVKKIGITNSTFKNTLITLDKDYQNILTLMLIYSYIYKNKEIEYLSKKICIKYNYEEEKIKKLLNELTFNIIPSVSPIFNFEKTNGFLYMKFNGKILYFHNGADNTKNFIYKNLKFDTPSSNKFEICKVIKNKDRKVFFLYLQIRMKRKNKK